MKQTDGKWSQKAAPIYFAANVTAHMEKGVGRCENQLLAVGDVSEKNLEEVERLCETNAVLLDSGVFGVAMRHAQSHGLSHDEGLKVPIAEIDGFVELEQLYHIVMNRLKAKCWGYIEIDLGGRDQKRKTRKKLEKSGLNPIPVFHPLNDGWKYFDELADQYDRICVGNLVKANDDTRQHILTEVHRRRKGKAVKWIHALGVSPSPLWMSCPTESCDSTSWCNVYMYGGDFKEWSSFGSIEIDELQYRNHKYDVLATYAARSAGHTTDMIRAAFEGQR